MKFERVALLVLILVIALTARLWTGDRSAKPTSQPSESTAPSQASGTGGYAISQVPLGATGEGPRDIFLRYGLNLESKMDIQMVPAGDAYYVEFVSGRELWRDGVKILQVGDPSAKIQEAMGSPGDPAGGASVSFLLRLSEPLSTGANRAALRIQVDSVTRNISGFNMSALKQ